MFVCFTIIVYLITVRFGFHLCLNSKIVLFVLSLICRFNWCFTCFKIYLFIYISTYCIFFAVVSYLISVPFGLHLYFNSKIFLFVLGLTSISNLSVTCFKIYLFIYISTCCMFFATIFYLISHSFWVFNYSLIVISGCFEFELL